MKKLVVLLIVAMAVIAVQAQAAPIEPYRLAFVTLPAYQAGETDIAVYNGLLQAEADAAGIGNTSTLLPGGVKWFVIGSTAAVDARDNTGTNPSVNGTGVPIYLTDMATQVADDNSDLWDGNIDNIINTLADGTVTTGHLWAWTGSSSLQDGTKADGINNSGGPLGTQGEVVQGNGGDVATWQYRQWTSDPYTNSLPLYAMSEIIPEPATMSLLALGGLALLRRRRRA